MGGFEQASLHLTGVGDGGSASSRPALGGNLLNGRLMGDSIVAAVFADATALAVLTAGGRTVASSAVNGHTVANQWAAWIALTDAVKSALDWVVVQLPVNNIAAGESFEEAFGQLSGFIAAIQNDARSARVVVSLVCPCKAYVGLSAGEFTVLQQVNTAIAALADSGTSVRVCSAHYALLSDGSDNLAAAVDSGDHLHPNAAGSLIQAQQWRAVLG